MVVDYWCRVYTIRAVNEMAVIGKNTLCLT
nr:MAG TPA: hypothetical protein [Caudoviricetes sp.]